MDNLCFGIEGVYTFKVPGKPKFQRHNTIVSAGALLFLETLLQGQDVLPTNFYIGLTTIDYDYSTTLSEVAVYEPSTDSGYARMPVPRSTSGWTVSQSGNAYRGLSTAVTFGATTDWDKTWQQAFLCDVASGTEGNLISVSGKASEAQTVVAGSPPTVDYVVYLRGLGSES